MSRPQPTTYGRVLLSALASLFLGIVLPGAPAAAAIPQYTLEERATAVASPALIYIEAQFTGYLRRRDSGERSSRDGGADRARYSRAAERTERVDRRATRPQAQAAWISATVFGISFVRLSGSPSVTRTSSSMRTPMPRHSGATLSLSFEM